MRSFRFDAGEPARGAAALSQRPTIPRNVVSEKTAKAIPTTFLMAIALAMLCVVGNSSLSVAENKAMTNSQATLLEAFKNSLKRVEDKRKEDRRTTIDVTESFADFYRDRQIVPYAKLMESVNLPLKRTNNGPIHFAYVELRRDELRRLGFERFFRGDKVVIQFTTRSAASNEIVSFKAVLLNPEVF
jgi:hypothetical protein